jgi:hypothetical protein
MARKVIVHAAVVPAGEIASVVGARNPSRTTVEAA